MISPASASQLARAFLIIGALFAVNLDCFGQEAARSDRGAMPNRTYSLSEIESISLQNGNLSLSIPLASLPPIAGGKLSWTVNARYNSKLWDVLRAQADAVDLQWYPYVVDTPAAGGGWAIGGQYAIFIRNSNEDFSRL